MKFWIYVAVCFLVIGTLFPILRGDGAGAAEGMIGGLGVLAIVLIIAALVWLVRLPFKKKE
ncbi:TM2 domain-containing membrane protein YozV [Roseovarius sp. MBR-51]